ncbi:MAG: ABC transporter six-transmembrane domain-containing protein [Bacteroidota bacterium]
MEAVTQETGVGRQSASKVLAGILKQYPGKLSITGGLVLAENGLELLYPVIAGVALDAVLEGNLSTAFIMMGIIFTFWLVGALRRAVDTRVYTHIYKELAGKVILSERRQGLSPNSTIVHAGLARQFVDFFEIQVPAFVTAIISVAGAVIMLVILEPLIGVLAAGALLFSVLSGFRFMRKSQRFAEWLHDQKENEPLIVTKGTPLMIARHFHVVGGRRIQLSDLEAKAYLGIGLIAAMLFGALFIHMGTKSGVTAGHLFMLINYVWTFVENLDKMPEQLQQIGKLRELGTRINPES